jgi:mRNA-degrading endonuclease RelE of RelBE toxin-antitoxin system
MSYQLLFHPDADKEYRDAYQWYEQERKGLGERFEKMVEQRLQQIAAHPENYGFSKKMYREVSTNIFPYSIVYKLNKRKKVIYIAAIYHAKRNPKGKYRK